MLVKGIGKVLSTIALVSVSISAPLFAEEAAVPVAPVAPVAAPAPVVAPAPVTPPAPVVAPAPEKVSVTPDTAIFRRTPVIDGVVNDGEWDTFYTYSGSNMNVTTYADWDNGNLYIGVKSNKPIDMLTILDANSDGWFNGSDNYEFRAVRGANDAVALSIGRYESKNSKVPAATPVSAGELAMVTIKSGKANDSYSIEMKVPATLARNLKFGRDKKMGMLIGVKDSAASAWIPSDQPAELSTCNLTTIKLASLKPLNIDFDLKDTTIARGDDLVGRFHITNSGTESVDAYKLIIAGEGNSDDYLNSSKIRMESLLPKKHYSEDYRSTIPYSMPVGSWALGAEVSSPSGRLGGVIISFDVLEPFVGELILPTKQVPANVKDVTTSIMIINNTRHEMRGTVKITLPAGWELWRNLDTRDFIAASEVPVPVKFEAKPPLGAIGSIPVKVEIKAEGITKTIEGSFTVVNP